MPEKCCYTIGMTHVDEPIFCPNPAQWEVFTDKRDESPALACSEHLGFILSDAPKHYIYPYEEKQNAPTPNR